MDKLSIRKDPKGVVLIIGSWNYPVMYLDISYLKHNQILLIRANPIFLLGAFASSSISRCHRSR
jgi:hypothetical protein